MNHNSYAEPTPLGVRGPRLATLCFAALVALLSVAPARAHDPSECWTEVIFHADKVEVLVTMAQVATLRLIDPAKKIPVLSAENFAEHRPRLLQEGATLFALTSLKTRLKQRSVVVELTEENDVSFKIEFPRPPPGLLVIEAEFIRKLGSAFGGLIDARDTEGHQLGWDQITSESPTLVVMLPPPGADPKKK